MNLDKEKAYLSETKEGQYLKAADLPKNFNERLTIDKTDEATFEVDDGTESFKLVLFFKGKDKGITLSTTNLLTVKGAFGPETDSWTGKDILLSTKYYPKFQTSGFIVNAIPDLDEGKGDDIPW